MIPDSYKIISRLVFLSDFLTLNEERIVDGGCCIVISNHPVFETELILEIS